MAKQGFEANKGTRKRGGGKAFLQVQGWAKPTTRWIKANQAVVKLHHQTRENEAFLEPQGAYGRTLGGGQS